MINVACEACVAAAVAATGAKDTVPYPELFVNVTAAVLGAALCGIYVAGARYWRKNIGQRLPGLWHILGLAGVLSLVCWVAPRALFLPADWENQPFPVAGAVVTLCLCAATVAVTTRGCSRGEKLLSAIVGCLGLPSASVLLAIGSAEILFLEGSHVWEHLLTLVLIWVSMAACASVVSCATLRYLVPKNEEKTQ
jgi:hypothetical protein